MALAPIRQPAALREINSHLRLLEVGPPQAASTLAAYVVPAVPASRRKPAVVLRS